MMYRINRGSVSLGGKRILDQIDFEIKGKEKIAVVGRNGAGKTTLLRLIAGDLSLDADDRRFSPGIVTDHPVSVGSLSQDVLAGKTGTIRDLMMDKAPVTDPYGRENYEYEVECLRQLAAVGFSKDDWKKEVSSFSGGEQTRIALVFLLMQSYDILLLDEPTNHLDLEAVSWLEERIRAYPGAVLIVSHDRYFLDQTVDLVYEIADGKLYRYAGNYSQYRDQKHKNAELARKNYAAMVKEQQRLTELIERFKHKPRKAAMTRAKKKQLERLQKVAPPPAEEAHIFTHEIVPDRKGPKTVLETKKLVFGYDRPLGKLDYLLRRGRKTGIIGPNGAGKSALLKTLAGQIPPVRGEILKSPDLELACFDQMSSALAPEIRVIDYFKRFFPGWEEKTVRQTLAAYLFRGEEAGRFIKDLSGGERSRLYLARILESRPQAMFLDEPTNHMDIPARETLESAWKSYRGTMLFVTHDRYLLKELADSLLIFTEEGLVYYPFGYEHYQRMLRKRASGIQSGVDVIEAENTRLMEDLAAVPKKERHQTAAFNTEQAYTDWQLTLARERLDQMDRSIKEYEEGFSPDKWMDSSYDQGMEKLMQEYTRQCLVWYDHYQEYEKAFLHYREE